MFSKANLKTKKIYNYKYFSNFKDIANRNQIEINLNKENTINSEGKIFNSINFSFKKSRKKIRNEKLKLQRSENIQKIKSNKNNSDRENDKNDINNLKMKNQMKNKILDIFLPPLSKNINFRESNIDNQTKNINRHLTRYALYTINSINNISLGHTDENNIDKKLLSNFNFKKSTKSKSINIKRAQILLLKNRDKKAKLILQRKNVLNNFIDEDIFC